MKRILLFIFCLATISLCKAQIIIDTADYHFTAILDTSIYNMTSPVTVIGPHNTVTDTVTGMVPIGFHFYYMGRQYDSVSINEYGFLALGASAIQPGNNYLNNDTTTFPVLSPYWVDIITGTDGSVQIQTMGSAPNRMFVVQWNVVVPPGGGGTYLGIIQLILHENNNQIEYRYANRPGYSTGGLPTPANGPNPGEMTGIKDFVNGSSQYIKCEFQLIFNTTAATPQYNTGGQSVNNAGIEDFIEVLYYADSSANNAPINFSCTPTPTEVLLNWTDNSSAEDIFKIYRSSDSVNFHELRTVRSTTKSGTGTVYNFTDTFGVQFGTTYYYRIVASALGGAPSPALTGTAHAAPPLLSGVKTIPGDYPSITAAVQDIYYKFLAGPIILEVQQSYDSVNEENPINIDSRLYNPSPTNTITIRPAANVTSARHILCGPGFANGTIQLSGGHNYMIFDGSPGGLGTGRMLGLNNILTYDSVSDLRITNMLMQSFTTYNVTANSVISNCDLNYLSQNNSYGISLNAYTSNINIDSNYFHDYNGIAISGTVGNRNLHISYNNFYRIAALYGSGVISILDTAAGSMYVIDSNYIGGTAPGATGIDSAVEGFTAITVKIPDTSHIYIVGNTIRGQYTVSGFSSYEGINVTGGNLDIENNMIGDSTTEGFHCGSLIAISASVSNNQLDIIKNNVVAGIMANAGEVEGITYSQNNYSYSNAYTYIENNTIGARSQYMSIMGTGVGCSGGCAGISGISATGAGHLLISNNSINNAYWALAYEAGPGTGYPVGVGISGLAPYVLITNNSVYNFAGTGISGSPNSYAMQPDITQHNVVIEHNAVKYFVQTGINAYLALINANTVYSNLNRFSATVNLPINGIAQTGSIVTNNFVSLGYDTLGQAMKSAAWMIGISAGDASAGMISTLLNNTVNMAEDSVTPNTYKEVYGSSFGAYNSGQFVGTTQSNIFLDKDSSPYVWDAGVYALSVVVSSSHDWCYDPYDTAFGLYPNSFSNLNADTFSTLGMDPLLVLPYGQADLMDLHLQPTSPAGSAVPADLRVQTDIDGNFRPISGMMSAGAHELHPLNLTIDHTPPLITYTPLPDGVTGYLGLSANISDSSLVMGQNSSAPPYIYYTLKGTGSWAQYQGALVSGNLQTGGWHFSFSDTFLHILNPGDTVQYFVVAEDVWGNLATNATGGSGYNTAFINAFPPQPDFFVVGACRPDTTLFAHTMCQGEIYTFGSMNLTLPGVYTNSLTNVNGCDSALILTLTVYSISNTNIPQSICAGDSFLFDHIAYHNAGIYYDTLQNVRGCDSIVALNLTILAPAISNLAEAICPGSTYTFDGNVLSGSGIYHDTLIGASAYGCDSIITLDLSVKTDTVTAYFTLQPSGIAHLWYVLNQCTGTDLSYLWSWGDGTTSTGDTPSHVYAAAGNYNVCVTATDSLGCSAMYCDTNVYLYKNGSGQMVYIEVLPQYPAGINTLSTNDLTISYYNSAVHFSQALRSPAELSLYDLSGRLVMRQENFSGTVWNLPPDLSQGVYVLHVQSAGYSVSQKLPVLR